MADDFKDGNLSFRKKLATFVLENTIAFESAKTKNLSWFSDLEGDRLNRYELAHGVCPTDR